MSDPLSRLDAIVRATAAEREARVEDRAARCDVATGRLDPGGFDVVTRLGERISTTDLASTAEVLAYVRPTRPFDPRYVVSPVEIDRTRHDRAAELDDAIDR